MLHTVEHNYSMQWKKNVGSFTSKRPICHFLKKIFLNKDINKVFWLQGVGKWTVLNIVKCPEHIEYPMNFDIVRKKVNRSHDGFTGKLKFDETIDDKYGVSIIKIFLLLISYEKIIYVMRIKKLHMSSNLFLRNNDTVVARSNTVLIYWLPSSRAFDEENYNYVIIIWR